MWGSGTLHQFEPEIPWNPGVITRVRELERGDWRAEGASQAVARATAAMIAASLPSQNEGVG